MNKLTYIALFLCISFSTWSQAVIDDFGAIARSDTAKPVIYLIFTGHDYFEGFDYVTKVLDQKNVKASFFLTGDFIRTHPSIILQLKADGHFIGAHSDKHLLYCDWTKRDSLLHSEAVIKKDISDNLIELKKLGIKPKYFMPPYEWYNKKVVEIATSLNQVAVNFSQGTRSNADYTTPSMPNYVESQSIINSIYNYEKKQGMNGFHLLIHPGTAAERTDKLWFRLEEIIDFLLEEDYQFSRL